MIPIKGKISGVAETASAISQLPSLIIQAGMGGMTEILEFSSKTVRERFLRGPYPTEIERRTGSFAATFARGHKDNIWRVNADGLVIHGVFGSTDKRGRVLEEGTGYLPGGVIKPKRGQYLAIPAKAAMTPTGRLRSQYVAAKTSWRNVPNTFVNRSEAGGLYIAERTGKGRIRVLAWLVRSVYIKGRFYMRKTADVVRPQAPKIIQRRIDQLITRFNATIARLRG